MSPSLKQIIEKPVRLGTIIKSYLLIIKIMIADILGFIFSLGLILFSGYLISLLLFRKTNITKRLILSFGLGTGTNSILMILLGSLYNFQLVTVLTSYSILTLSLLYLNRKNLSRSLFKVKMPRINKKASLIVIPFVLFSLFHAAFFPELYSDALLYGQLARIHYNNKDLSYFEGGPSIALGYASGYPSGFQLIQVFIYLFTGESLLFIRVFSCFVFALFILLIYNWAKEFFKQERAILISLTLFVTLPIIILFSRISSQYMYLAFQFSLACYFLHKFLIQNEKQQLFFSSIFAGFASLTSYLGLTFLPILFLSISPDKKSYKYILFSLIIFSLVISPWYVRDFILTGNPIWPFGGGKYVDEAILKENSIILEDVSQASGFSYNDFDTLENSLYRLFSPSVNLFSSYINGLRPVFTIFAILALIYWVKDRNKHMKLFVTWFLVVLLAYVLFIRISERYLILISIPTVFLSVYFLEFLFKQKLLSKGKFLIIILLAIIYAYGFLISVFWDGCYADVDQKMSFKFFEILGDKWKAIDLCYGNGTKIWKHINNNLPQDAVIATTELKMYYIDRKVVAMDSWALREIYHNKTADTLHSVLTANNVDYIIVEDITNLLKKYPNYFSVEYEEGNWKIYKVNK